MEQPADKFKKYNEKKPNMTIRLPSAETKALIANAAKQAGKTVSKYVLSRLFPGPKNNDSGSNAGSNTSSNTTTMKSIKDDFHFVFTLFQKNARNISVTSDDKAMLKQIIERMKGL